MIEAADIQRTLAQLNSEGPNNYPCPSNCKLHPRGCECPDDPDNMHSMWTTQRSACESQHNPNQSVATQVEQFYHNMRTWQSHCEMLRQAVGDSLPTVTAGLTGVYDDLQAVADKTVALYGVIARANLDATAKSRHDMRSDDVIAQLTPYITRWDVETQVWGLLDADGKLVKAGSTTGGRTSVQIPGLEIRNAIRAVGKAKAPYAVLLHTHPGNDASPSWEDVQSTMGIGVAMYSEGVNLVEHFVLTRSGGYSRVMPQLQDWGFLTRTTEPPADVHGNPNQSPTKLTEMERYLTPNVSDGE